MKRYLSLLILSTFTLYGAPPPSAHSITPNPENAPPVTTSPAYLPPKFPEKTPPSSRWKIGTLAAITVAGIALGLIASGKGAEKKAPSHE